MDLNSDANINGLFNSTSEMPSSNMAPGPVVSRKQQFATPTMQIGKKNKVANVGPNVMNGPQSNVITFNNLKNDGGQTGGRNSGVSH